MARTNGYARHKLDHWDGVNTDSPVAIAPSELVSAINVEFTQEGKIRPRPGQAKRFSSDFDTNPVIGIAPYYKSDGTTRLVMAAGTTLYADKPHVIFNYDSQTDWNSGVHDLDSTTTAGDIALLPAPTSAFARSTVAYNDDGTQVAANTPRYKAGKYNNGGWVEEGTQQLAVNASFEVYTGTNGVADGWYGESYTGITASYAVDSTVHRPSGSYSQKITIASATATGNADVKQDYSVGAGVQLTFSAYVKVTSVTGTAKAFIYMSYFDSAGTYLGNSGTSASITSVTDWTQLQITGTTPANTVKVKTNCTISISATTDNIVAYFDDAQLEQKPYPTSIIFANDTTTQPTRSADNLSHTLPQALPVRNAGCLWYVPTYGSSTLTRLIQLMSGWNTAATPVNRYSVKYDGGAFHFGKNDGTTWYDLASAAVSFAAGDTIFIAWLDDPVAGVMKLWYGINGAALTEVSLANTVQITDAQKVYWGCYSSAGYEADGVIDDPQLYSAATIIASGGAVDVNFWNAIYTSTAAQAWSLNTLLHTTLDNTLDVDADRQGQWVSPVQNATTSTDYSTLTVTWNLTAPANTTVACQVRTSADGATWSAWYDQTNGGASIAPANPYSQVRLLLQEIANATTPSVHIATASYEGAPAATAILTGLSVTSKYSFAQLADYLVVCNGVDLPKKYDGTTIADITTAPRAFLAATYKNRLFMAKDAVNRSRLYFSDILNIDSWPATNLIDVNPNDGDEIMALLPTSMTLLIVKQHATFFLQGYSPSTFSVSTAGEGGTISPWGIVWSPYGIFRLDREGVWQTDFRKQVLLSRKIQGIWDGLNARSLSNAALMVYGQKLLVGVANATANNNNLLLVYDLARKAWSVWDTWTPAAFALFWERGKWTYLYGSSASGNVYQIGGADNDAGTAFTATIETAHTPLVAEEVMNRLKWMDWTMDGGSADTTISYEFKGTTTTAAAKTFTLPAATEDYVFRAYPPPFGRAVGVKLQMQNTTHSGPTLLAMETVFFPRGVRPQRATS